MARRTAAQAAGTRIRALRLERGWLHQNDLAGPAGVSQRCVSLLERGEVRHPRPDTRQRIADAFGLARAAVFGDFEAELVRREETFDLVGGAAYLGVAHDTLRWAAKKRRVRHRRDGHRWQFDREALDEAREAYPCPEDGCDRVALGPSGGCEAHGHVLETIGKKRPVEVSRAISKTKRENPKERPDAKDRADRLHDERRKSLEDELAPGELTRSGAAAALGIVPHGVNALVADGELEVARYIEHEIGQPSPIFSEATINARKRKVAQAESANGTESWRALRLDPEWELKLARSDGRLERLAATLGSVKLAEAAIRAQAKSKRADYRRHKRGRTPNDDRRARLRALLTEVQEDDFLEFSDFNENELLAYIAMLNWQRNRADFGRHWTGDEYCFDQGFRPLAIKQVRHFISAEATKALQIAGEKIA
jgi:transcriptional regulator with XRE-family HTH domain